MIAIPVKEQSQVAGVRRRAVATAQSIGFGEADAGRVAIVVTELATNLVKHGSGGEILVSAFEDVTGCGVELLALDKGRGMANVQACLEDGYSTAGSSGNGLGAVLRQSHFVDIASWPNQGTAVLAQLQAGRPPPAPLQRLPPWGCVSLPKLGEEACGDAWGASMTAAGCMLMVADGLGHGPEAAEASVEAVRLFYAHQGRAPAELLEYLHAGLRATRGAAVSVAQIDAARQEVTFAGIGNVAGVVVGAGGMRRMISHNGIAGHNARKFQAYGYPLEGGLVIIHSDGLSSSWTLDRYPGLAVAHPTLIAGVLYRDFSRGRDDVTILVASRT